MYSFSAYGTEGVEKAIQILHVRFIGIPFFQAQLTPIQDEFEMNMRLLGARTLKEVVPEMVDASNLQSHIVVPRDDLYGNNCAFLLQFDNVC